MDGRRDLIFDKVRHRDPFNILIKVPNREPEKFPGNSVEEDEERVEKVFSEIDESGADFHIQYPS